MTESFDFVAGSWISSSCYTPKTAPHARSRTSCSKPAHRSARITKKRVRVRQRQTSSQSYVSPARNRARRSFFEKARRSPTRG